MLSVSGPDWPKTRRADWPISVVLIGQNHGSHQSPLMELSNTIHTQCTRKRTLNAIIHTAIHNVHSHTSHSHNKFKQTRDRQQQSPLGDTLNFFYASQCWETQFVNTFQNFTKLSNLIIGGASQTVFPNLSTACGELKGINVRNNITLPVLTSAMHWNIWD